MALYTCAFRARPTPLYEPLFEGPKVQVGHSLEQRVELVVSVSAVRRVLSVSVIQYQFLLVRVAVEVLFVRVKMRRLLQFEPVPVDLAPR